MPTTIGLEQAPRCGKRKKSDGTPCKSPAIRGPNGEVWPCRMHGGAGLVKSLATTIKTGRYSKTLKGKLAELVAEFQDDPDLLKLDGDIALMRGLVARMAAQLKESEEGTVSPEGVKQLTEMTEALSRVIQRRQSIANEERYTVTAMKLRVWLAQAADVVQDTLQRYIEDPEKLAEARARVRRGLEGIGV